MSPNATLTESLANATALSRPPTVTLEDARVSAISAIRAFVETRARLSLAMPHISKTTRFRKQPHFLIA